MPWAVLFPCLISWTFWRQRGSCLSSNRPSRWSCSASLLFLMPPLSSPHHFQQSPCCILHKGNGAMRQQLSLPLPPPVMLSFPITSWLADLRDVSLKLLHGLFPTALWGEALAHLSSPISHHALPFTSPWDDTCVLLSRHTTQLLVTMPLLMRFSLLGMPFSSLCLGNSHSSLKGQPELYLCFENSLVPFPFLS